MFNRLFLIATTIALATACAPRFNTTTNPAPAIELEKTKIRSLYGTWHYHFDGEAFSFDLKLIIDESVTQISTTCFNKDLQTSISSLSRSQVVVGKITFIDGITGVIKAGNLDCGINFPAAAYAASLKGDILTIVTASGPVDFRHAGPQ